jgi:hypothetical protein
MDDDVQSDTDIIAQADYQCRDDFMQAVELSRRFLASKIVKNTDIY